MPQSTTPAPARRWFGYGIAIVCLLSLIQLALRPAITYRTLESGLDVAWVGVLAATFNLTPLVLTIPVGRWMDSGHHRPAAICSGVALTVATIGFAFAQSVPWLVIWSLMAGGGTLVLATAIQSMIAIFSPITTYESRFAMFSVSGSAGQAMGGLLVSLAPVLFLEQGTTAVFWSTCIAAAAILVLSFQLRGPQRPLRAGHHAAPAERPAVLTVLRTPGLRTAMVASLLVVATIDLFAVYMPVLGLERGFTAVQVGVLITVRAVATVIARVFMPALSRILGPARLFTLSVFGAALAVGTFVIPASFPITIAICASAGLLLGFGQPLSMAVVARLAPPSSRGLAMSLRMSGNMAGLALLPLAVGPLIGTWGVAVGFLAPAVALGVAGFGVARIRN